MSARLSKIVAVALAAALAGGCGLHVLPHRVGLAAPRAHAAPAPRESAHPADALAEARAQAALQPAEPYWPYREGALLAAADSLPAAEAALRAALARQSTYAPALALLSKLWYDAGRSEEAARLLAPVREHPEAFAPSDRDALLAGLALHEAALGRDDLAAALPDGAREGSVGVYLALRGAHPDSAAAPAAAALRTSPKSAACLDDYGITRLRAGDPDGARHAFLEAIRRDPARPGPYYNLAILERFYAFDDAAAASWFREYWKRSHDDPDSLRAVFLKGDARPLAEDGR